MNIKKGDLIIINDSDRPCARMIAKVTSINSKIDRVYAKYISSKLKNEKCYSSPDNVTKVTDFGVQVYIEKDRYMCLAIGRSKATYRDGMSRQWQEDGSPIQYIIKSLIQEK